MAKIRKFNGKSYTLINCGKKAEMGMLARKRRRFGWFARVHNRSRGVWELYIREK